MFGHYWRLVVAVILPVALVAAGALSAPPANAATEYAIAWTQIGIYPRAAPSMDAERVGSALSDGYVVSIECETSGAAVSNGYQSSEVWERLSDGTYLPNGFIDTGVDGWTPGVPRCDAGTYEAASSDEGNWHPYCGASEYFTEIVVEKWSNGYFKILAEPTAAARTALDAHEATVAEWHAIQDCVSGLYGELADSIWDQLSCHQHLALVPGKDGWATGDTYDLESWRGTFDETDWFSSHCGNEYNADLDPQDDPVWFGRPDEGVTDLSYPDNIG